MDVQPLVTHAPLRSAPRRAVLEPGSALTPTRHVLEHLGGGERFEAWLAWDEELLAPVVAKVLRPRLRHDITALAGLRREAGALQTLRHPFLVRSFDAVLGGEWPHLALEYVEGPRLSTLVRRFGPLSPEQLILLARQLVAAVHHIGRRGWVHLDIKPRNIVMAGAPRLIDLSVARPIDDARRVARQVGTDAYMAPEQADLGRLGEIDTRTDMWGLGVTLHEAVTGRQAYPSAPGVRFPQLTAGPPAMPARVPSQLAAAIAACLHDRPSERPTPGEFYDLLEPLVDWASRSVRRIR